jgi:4-amino-4-deoxy-L-arabinose transferase-like glycosyltransferase
LQKTTRHFALVIALLLLAAGLRTWQLGTLPPGFSSSELDTLAITKQVRTGQVVVFESVRDQGQETMFHVLQAALDSVMGDGLITLRLGSVWAGLFSLAMVYSISRRLHGGRAAIIALSLMTVSFWPILLSRLSLREAMVPAFTTAVLLAMLNAFHIRRQPSPDMPTTTAFTVLGFVVAASLYAHWFGLFLLLILTISVMYLFITRQQISRYAGRASTFGILLSLIISIPYIATTLRLPDISGLATLGVAMSPDNILQAIIGGIATIFPRGDLNPAYNLPGRPLLGPVAALLLAYGIISGIKQRRKPGIFIPVIALLVGLPPVLLSTETGSFLSLVGILPLIYIVIAQAADSLLGQIVIRRPDLRRAAPWIVVLLVAANLLWTGFSLFEQWRQREDVRVAYHAERGLLARHLDENAADIPIVVCSPQLIDTEAGPGDPNLLAMMMQRSNAPLRYVDCANGLIVADGGAQQHFAVTDTSIYERMYPDLQNWLADRVEVNIAGLAPRSVLEIDAATELEDAVGQLLTTAPTGWAPESPGGAGSVELPARFGGNLTFLGYTPTDDTTYEPGAVIPVVTFWRVDGRVPPDLRIFTHLLSDPAAVVAQSAALNVWPTTLHSRDVFVQVSYIALPESIPDGAYVLSTGTYRANDGRRMPVFDGEHVRGDRLFLYQISISREE